jgi:hypothetical protein
VIFSAASAARMHTSGFSDHNPAMSSGKSWGRFNTIAATSSERPIIRRSPPSSSDRMFVRGMTK